MPPPIGIGSWRLRASTVMTPGALLVRLRRDPTFAFELLRRLSGRVRALNARLIAAMAAHEELRPSGAEALLYSMDAESEVGKPAANDGADSAGVETAALDNGAAAKAAPPGSA